MRSVYLMWTGSAQNGSGDRRIYAGTLEEVCTGSDVLFLSLPNSDTVEKVMDTVFSLGVKGKLVIDLSTSNPVSTRKLYGRMKALGGDFVDSPLIAGHRMPGTRPLQPWWPAIKKR